MAQRVQTEWHDAREFMATLARAINGILDGRQNNFGTFTLAASVTSTVVSDRRVGVDSVITLMPTTANAAGELATLYIATVTAGSFTVTHSNAATADRTYRYEVTG